MSIFIEIYHFLVFQPLLNALIFLYETLPGGDLGIAIIVLTILVRFVLYPLTAQGIRAQQKLARLQPKIRELQKKLQHNKQEQGRAIFDLYKKERVNPFAGIFPLLVQLPLLIALYHLFSQGIGGEQLALLYSFVPYPEDINPMFLGVLDISKISLPLALVAGVLQFIQAKQASFGRKQEKKGDGKPDFASMMQTQMVYIFPIVAVVIVSQLPSAFGLYWVATTLFSIWQQWFVAREESSPEGDRPQPAKTAKT